MCIKIGTSYTEAVSVCVDEVRLLVMNEQQSHHNKHQERARTLWHTFRPTFLSRSSL